MYRDKSGIGFAKWYLFMYNIKVRSGTPPPPLLPKKTKKNQKKKKEYISRKILIPNEQYIQNAGQKSEWDRAVCIMISSLIGRVENIYV